MPHGTFLYPKRKKNVLSDNFSPNFSPLRARNPTILKFSPPAGQRPKAVPWPHLGFLPYIKPQQSDTIRFRASCCISSLSYIKPQLYEPLNYDKGCCISSLSYIKPQPCLLFLIKSRRCISSLSYIKPQLSVTLYASAKVVFLPYPTSNRNSRAA